jgi:hypothetical protein
VNLRVTYDERRHLWQSVRNAKLFYLNVQNVLDQENRVLQGKSVLGVEAQVCFATSTKVITETNVA